MIGTSFAPSSVTNNRRIFLFTSSASFLIKPFSSSFLIARAAVVRSTLIISANLSGMMPGFSKIRIKYKYCPLESWYSLNSMFAMESKALVIFPISLRTSILFNLLSYKRIISCFRCKYNKKSIKKNAERNTLSTSYSIFLFFFE